MPSLSHPLYAPPGACGLSQNWSASPRYRGFGCGPVAALMVLCHLSLYHPDGQSAPLSALSPVPTKEQCTQLLDTVGQRYFPVIPRYGMNGLSLALCMNRYFRRYRMDYRATWYARRMGLLEKTAEMLEADIPVVFSVGPDFPLIWQKHPVPLYGNRGDSMPQCSVRAHYMVATGLDDQWLTLSSWGRKYALSVPDWLHHHRYHSGGLVDGILYIRKRKKHW